MADQENTQIAVYLDLENIRYSMLNIYGQEPDFRQMMDKIRLHGRPSVMRAYADFSEHPPATDRDLRISGFDPINVATKKISTPNRGSPGQRIKNAADMVLAIDAIVEASDAHANGINKTFYLITGDSDFIKLVTQIRNKFDQRVVVCGVPGSMSHDLRLASDGVDEFEVPAVSSARDEEVLAAIVKMIIRGKPPLGFWSMKLLDQWSQDERNAIPGTAKQHRDALSLLLTDEVLLQKEREFKGRTITETYLNQERAKEKGYLWTKNDPPLPGGPSK